MGDSDRELSPSTKYPRISKEDLFAVLAFWMERCPLNGDTPPERLSSKNGQFGVNKAGAVFVNQNNRVVAMDCSRKLDVTNDVVHAAARVLINFPDKVKGCTVYMSRKPCSFCVKLLVQAGVSRIRFLPFQPEASSDEKCKDLDNAQRIENLLRICSVGMSVYVPTITTELQKTLESSIRKSGITQTPTQGSFENSFQENYWFKEHDWVKRLDKISKGTEEDIFRCSGLVINDLMHQSMGHMAKWIATTTMELVPNDVRLNFDESQSGNGGATQQNDYKPDEEVARHMLGMSLIASRRTDDPDRLGVGVIIMMNDEVISVGLNGFPSKSLFGDFPRSFPASSGNPASEASPESGENPYLLHAEQNALLLRNTRDIDHESTTAYISEVPCADCLTLLVEAGVETLVLPRRPLTEWPQFPNVKTYYFDRDLGDSYVES